MMATMTTMTMAMMTRAITRTIVMMTLMINVTLRLCQFRLESPPYKRVRLACFFDGDYSPEIEILFAHHV